QGALAGGVLRGDAEQPADGVLPSVDAGQGRAAPRRPLRADRRAGVGPALPRRARRPRTARADVRERAASRSGGSDCRVPSAECRVRIAEWGLSIGAAARAVSQVWM